MNKILITIIFSFLLFTVYAQKGEKSISAGPFISYPFNTFGYRRRLSTGLGLEATGHYNLSNKSALLLRMGWTFYHQEYGYNDPVRSSITLFLFAGGYQYQFGNSGFFANFLAGIENETYDYFNSGAFTLGVGKRFKIKEERFIDSGIDASTGAESRLNLKVTFSLFQWPKIEN